MVDEGRTWGRGIILLLILFLAVQVSAANTAPALEVITTQCSDGVDNDSDGKIDYPTDPGCSSFSDNNETDSSPTPPGGGGGGGGGGGDSGPVQTVVNFRGRAYPKSIVTLLKDAQVAATTVALSDASFQISLSGLAAGNYIFSIYGEDNKGNRSGLLTFPISITAGATNNISGIFTVPTIDVDKSGVKRGDDIAIFGQTSPDSEITIGVASEEEVFIKTKAAKDGVYLYNFDTSSLTPEQHFTRSKSAWGGEVSSFSKSISFLVGTRNVAKAATALKGDLNNDKRVNIVDFSIIAYWYKRPSPPANVDLNGDSKVDLIDFSIMAFHFTG
ncbi:MAG: dockerin type I repeat-containing protein [Candidatus Jorgensenbacteria bacterium]